MDRQSAQGYTAAKVVRQTQRPSIQILPSRGACHSHVFGSWRCSTTFIQGAFVSHPVGLRHGAPRRHWSPQRSCTPGSAAKATMHFNIQSRLRSGFSIENHPPARSMARHAFAVNLASSLASQTLRFVGSKPSGRSLVRSTLAEPCSSVRRASLRVLQGGAACSHLILPSLISLSTLT